VVRKDSAAGSPLFRKELCGGRPYGHRYIQYSPENGMPKGRKMGTSPCPGVMGAIKVGIGWISGHRITPGKLSAGKLSPVEFSIRRDPPSVCLDRSAGTPIPFPVPSDSALPRGCGAKLPTVNPPASSRLSTSPAVERKMLLLVSAR